MMMQEDAYSTYTFPNGLRVIHQRAAQPVAYCGYAVGVGTRHEDESHPGMAHFVEHMLFKGTGKRRSWHILNRMENVGGDLNAYTNKEETVVHCAFLCEHFDRAVELLSDFVFHSTFPENEVRKETGVILDEIQLYEDTPAELIYDEFENLIFSHHPLGRNILGEAGRIETYTRCDAEAFYGRYYKPGNMVFFVLGPFDFKQVLRVVGKYASGEPGGDGLPSRQPLSAYEPGVWRKQKDTHQSHIMVGTRAYGGSSEKRTALNLISNILGGPGMNSRLNVSLREHRGLVYDIEASYTPYTDTGTFCIYFGCDRDDIDRCLQLVHKELRRLREEKLSWAALRAAKKQMIGQLGVAQDNRENNALSMGKAFLHYNRVATYQQACLRIEQLTADDLQQVAQELLTGESLSTLLFCQ